MAQGDVTLYEEFLDKLGKKIFNLDTDTIKVALVTTTYTPTAADPYPTYGVAGTTNTSTNKVTAGGTYTEGGEDISSTWGEAAGVGTFDGGDISAWTQNASNPTDARWGIIYSDTATNKDCIGFVDLGSVFNMTTGALTIAWNASGIFTVTIS